MEEPRMTPQQRQACSILQRLPVELVFQIWGLLLRGEDSYENFNTVLRCAPELCWSVEIVTDDVKRCPFMFPCFSIRTLSMDQHELEMKTVNTSGKLIRRVFISFDSDNAIQTGELTAYEECRYARFFFGPSIDASYCLLSTHRGINTYTEELLLRFQDMAARKSSTLCVVSNPTNEFTVGTDMRFVSHRANYTYHTTTEVFSESSGRPLGYRVSLPETCFATYGEVTRLGPSPCINPIVMLTDEDLLKPQVHISFKGFKVPLVEYHKPGSTKYRQFVDFVDHDSYEKREELFEMNIQHTIFSMTNLNWSLATPHGRVPCGHSHIRYSTHLNNFVRQDQASDNALGVGISRAMIFAGLYKTIWLYGLPGQTVHRCLSRCELVLQEFVWFRLACTNDKEVQLLFPKSTMYTPSLKRIAVFSELRSLQEDLQVMPRFEGAREMDQVQFVALEGSDVPWDVGSMLSNQTIALKSLELLQLRGSSSKAEFLSIGWDELSFGEIIVQELTIGGYIPSFALPQDPLANGQGQLCGLLRRLCLDVSTIVTAHHTIEDSWYELYLPERRFPCLSHLYLKGVFSMSEGLHSYPKISLTKSCTALYLSSVIRTKAMVNGKVLEIPNTPVVADTFNSWLWCRATGDYVYSGAANDTFTRRIEEVDPALRPI